MTNQNPAGCRNQPQGKLQKLVKILAMAVVLCSLKAEAVGTGTLDQVSGWVPLGTSLTIHALPGTNSVFTAWQGNTNGANIAGAQITLSVTSSLSVTGLFSSVQSASKPIVFVQSLSLSGKSLALKATNGAPNGTWVLLQSTNLLLPFSQWQTNRTGTYDGNGNLSTNLVNTATNPVGFYLLK